MASGTLYSYPENFRAYKVLIAASYAQTNVKLAPNFVIGETNKSKEFLKKFSTDKIPAFESNDGKCLQDSNAIAYYVANEQLRGNSDYEKAQVLQWISFAESDLLSPVCAWVFPILGIISPQEESIKKAKENLKVALNTLNSHLLSRTYLVGERISLADIITACNLLYAYKYVLDPDYRKPFGNVNRWFTTLINQPQFSAVLGKWIICSKTAQPSSVAPNAAGDTSKKEPAAKSPKSKKEPAEPVEELDPTEEALAAEPKDNDPFSALPKGTFNFETFKRVYSNEDESKSIPYFWENFDPENYSIWYGEYKYPNELTKVFMSCNLITGMFQRLDKMRKQSFASVCLFGKDNDSTISGVWVWRGQGLAFELSPDWQIDYEVYDWKKLDPKSDDTKKLVQQYFSWKGEDKEGRKFNQGKIFK